MFDAIATAVTYTPPSSSVLLLSLSDRIVSEVKKEEIRGENAGRLLMLESLLQLQPSRHHHHLCYCRYLTGQ